MTGSEALRLMAEAKKRSGKSYRTMSVDTGLSPSFLKMVIDGGIPSRASGYRICKCLHLSSTEAKAMFTYWTTVLRNELSSWEFLLDEYTKECGEL